MLYNNQLPTKIDLKYIYIYISKGLQCALTVITIMALWQLLHLGHRICIYIYFLCPKCRSLHKTIMVVTVRAHCYPLDIYIYIYILYTKILEVNLFVFAYRLFRRDFSPLDGTYSVTYCMHACNMSRRVGRNLYETVCRQMQTN